MAPEQDAAGPVAGLAEAAAGASPEERLHRLLPPGRAPAHVPLVLLWRGEPMSSPDTIAVTASGRSDRTIAVRIELRRFDGPLHVNTVTVPVVEISLGALEPGRYDGSIEVATLWFTDFGHPETASGPETEHKRFSFIVA